MESRVKIALFSAAATVVLFAWLAAAMLDGETEALDQYLRLAIHSYASPTLTLFMIVITRLGATFSLVTISGFISAFLWRRRRRNEAARLAITMTGAPILENILKMALRRVRPEPFFGLAAPESFSFPSGHALAAICFFAVIAELTSSRTHSRPKQVIVWVAAVAAALSIGISRIYLGVHYPSDVAAGYLAGFAWLMTVRTGLALVSERHRPSEARDQRA